MANAVYREYPVPSELRPFVRLIWSLESDQPSGSPARERILPDGCVELVFHFRDQFYTHFADGHSAVQPQSFVVGQMKRFIEIEPRGRIGFVAVRLYAWGAYRVLPVSLQAATNGVVELPELWRKYAEWADRIASATTMKSRIVIVENLLRQALRSGRAQDSIVDRCLQLIEADSGECQIGRLASEIGASTRQLGRKFENAVGLSPKEFSRISRFRRALHQLQAKPENSLTETAVACGYYDQAHFNHEFREFAGIPPGELLTRADIAY